MNSNNNRRYGKHRVCYECGKPEIESFQVITIILPPTIPRRTNICRSCLQVVIDDSIEKNRAKQRVLPMR